MKNSKARHRVQDALLGDLCAILILGQTFGRIVSLLLDGIPSGRVWPTFILEAVGADRATPPASYSGVVNGLASR